jgi:molecular chaperone GrpE
MERTTETETDFAAAMQELSADATGTQDDRVASGISVLISGIHSLGQRIEALEESMVRKFEDLHFQKIEQQLTAIRESESVNQKLFDSLHEELINYRDNFVRDSLQKPVIRDLLVLFDDLNKIVEQVEASPNSGEGTTSAQLRNNLDNTLHFLVEIFHRLEVVEIESNETVDRTLHRIISIEKAESAEEDGQIAKRLKRGFMWRDKVLRPEEVVVKRFAAPEETPPTPEGAATA